MYSYVACLSRLTVYHAFLSRRGRVISGSGVCVLRLGTEQRGWRLDDKEQRGLWGEKNRNLRQIEWK